MMTMTITMPMNAAVGSTMMSTDMGLASRVKARHRGVLVFVIAITLSLASMGGSHAADVASSHAAVSRTASAVGETVKRDTKAIGATVKDGAHRIAVASKAVAHEIATVLRRSAAETRAAFRSKHVDTPAT
jgi:hypothetical protein